MSASFGRLVGRTAVDRAARLRLLHRWRIVLEQLGHRLRQVLLLLLRLGFRIKRLSRHAPPDELLLASLIHAHSDLPNVARAGLPGRRARPAAAIPSAAIP